MVSSLFVVCCLWCVLLLAAHCCLSSAGRCLFLGLLFWCVLFVVRCLLLFDRVVVVCCALVAFVAWCALFELRCLLCVVRYLLTVV